MSRPWWTGTEVTRPSAWRNRLCEPRCRVSRKPNRSSRAMTSRALRIGGFDTTHATTVCMPTNSASSSGSPSSRRRRMTSFKLRLSSSSVSA